MLSIEEARMKIKKKYLFMLAAALLVTLLISTGVLRRVDKWAQDTLYQHAGTASTDIVIIGIDEEALREQGSWPWSREVLADALCVLASDREHMPSVVAVDVLFAGASQDPAADAYLASAAGLFDNFVTACAAEFGEEITWEDGRAVSANTSAIIDFLSPYEALQQCTVQGHINAMLDKDGILRHALLYIEPAEGEKIYSMAYEAARLYLEQKGKQIREPSVNAGGHFYVPYTAGPETYYDGVSVNALLDGRVPSSYWDGKIVLIGPYAAALQDSYFTTIDKALPMYGVEFQANVIQSLIDGNYKKEIPDLPQIIILFILCAAAGILFMRLKVEQGGASCAGIMVTGFAGCLLLYKFGIVTHPLWLPAAAAVLYVISLGIHYMIAARERQRLALKEERISAELSLATRIQANALIKEFPAFPGRNEFDLYASMTPAKEIGGDLYDFFMMDEDHLCLVISDVSGKGVPAALFMMVAVTLMHYVGMREKSPARILQAVNNEICARNPEEMFVTVWLGVLEISTGKLTAANAGHEYPALKRADGHFELYKDKHGFVVGGMEGVRYREYEIRLDPGDKLFVYTDGVPEAQNEQEEFFGTDRMTAALQSTENGTAREILEGVAASIHTFVGGAPQFDDLTMLCMTYNGPAFSEKTTPPDGPAADLLTEEAAPPDDPAVGLLT